MGRRYYVYIMTNQSHSTLYTGVTSKLKARVFEHKEKLDPDSFTARYNINKLVYYETFENAESAIKREKQIKNLVRRRKIKLIDEFNLAWVNLYDDL